MSIPIRSGKHGDAPQIGGFMNVHLPTYGRAAAVGLAVGTATMGMNIYAFSGDKPLDSPGKLAAAGVGFVGGVVTMGAATAVPLAHADLRGPARMLTDSNRFAGFSAGALVGAGLGAAALYLKHARND